MTTRTWNGSTAAFSTAADWSPNGVPVAGDTAVISSGTVTASGSDLASSLVVQLSSGASATTFNLASAVVGGTDIVTTNAGSSQVFLGVNGSSSNQGVIVFAQSGGGNNVLRLTDSSAGASTLVNTGAIDFFNSIDILQNAGSNTANGLVNNGLLAMKSTASTPELVSSSVNISGTGTIQIGAGYQFETTGAIGSGQSVVMENRSGSGATLAIDNLPGFAATVYGFTQSGQINIVSPAYTTITPTTANGVTTITFSNNGATVGSINLAGTYNASNLSIQNGVDPNSGFEVTRINTSVSDATGSSGTIGVYRFFDKLYGTHFFTADVNEKNVTISSRSDLTEETNGFGAIDPAVKDPTAVAVYRFFDKRFGTHFFTADANEKNTLLSTRATSTGDLTYEPGETFFEHGTQQVGDVPVYRFFDKTYGTHFYTGDQNEFAAITKAGASTYRADLTYEGVGFYAPSGSYT